MSIPDKVQIATAGATFVLAVVTAYMAWQTRLMANRTREEAEAVREQGKFVLEQAEASRRQADVSALALQASIRPWLTAVPYGQVVAHEDEEQIGFSLPLRNIGSDLALLVPEKCLFITTRDVIDWTPIGAPTVAAVASSNNTEIVFTLKRHGRPHLTLDAIVDRPNTWGHFYVDVLYTDASGGQPTWARAHVCDVSERDGDWRVSDIAYRHDGEDEPFTSIRFRTP